MAETLAELEAKLASALAKEHATAGIKSTAIQDQRTDFDGAALATYISTLRQRIRALECGSTTRYAGVSKDC